MTLLDEGLEMVSRETFGDALEAVKGTAVPIQAGVEQLIQLAAVPRSEPALDEIDEVRLALAGHVLGNLDQGGIRREFHAAT